jgi:catechol 2,3-dioxygenase-like lactoylglutathione lyase family enzyme
MKRLHLHVGVADLDRSIGFYSTLFGASPTVRKHDYAKWMLDDPRVNFAISTRSDAAGLDHVGMQVDSNEELADITARLKKADAGIFEQENTTCCYARSDKTWVVDPSGLRWETFVTHGDATTYGAGPDLAEVATALVSATPRAAASCCG